MQPTHSLGLQGPFKCNLDPGLVLPVSLAHKRLRQEDPGELTASLAV